MVKKKSKTRCPHCEFWENAVRPSETFRLFNVVWDIDKAKKILEAHPRDPIHVPLSSLTGIVDYPLPEDGSFNLLRVHVEIGHIDHVDEKVPIIIGCVPKKRGENQKVLVLDGHHRIAKAIKHDLNGLSALLLTQKESDSCLLGSIHRKAGKK